jgi:hypothetical protein
MSPPHDELTTSFLQRSSILSGKTCGEPEPVSASASQSNPPSNLLGNLDLKSNSVGKLQYFTRKDAVQRSEHGSLCEVDSKDNKYGVGSGAMVVSKVPEEHYSTTEVCDKAESELETSKISKKANIITFTRRNSKRGTEGKEFASSSEVQNSPNKIEAAQYSTARVAQAEQVALDTEVEVLVESPSRARKTRQASISAVYAFGEGSEDEM